MGRNEYILNSNISARALLKTWSVSSTSISSSKSTLTMSSLSSYANGLYFTNIETTPGAALCLSIIGIITTTNNQGYNISQNIVGWSGDFSSSSIAKTCKTAYFNSNYTVLTLGIDWATTSGGLKCNRFYVLK